jgi:hypothetical protein
MADRATIDATLEAERGRIVRALRDLADRIERAPLDRVSAPLTLLAGLVEQLVRRAETMFGTRRPQ